MSSLSDHIRDATREERQQLEKTLLRGEQLLWAVRPIPSARVKNYASELAFCIPWLGITTLCTWAALGAPTSLAELHMPGGQEWGALAFLSIFWLIGLGMLAAPWLKKRSMKKNIYALTDRRALVMTGSGTEVYQLHEDLLCERKVYRQGRGDLIFGTGKIRSAGDEPKGFINVPDVQEAEERLEAAVCRAEAFRGNE